MAMNGFIYEPPFISTISVIFKTVGSIGSVINIGGIVVSLAADTRKMKAFSRFILNIQFNSSVSVMVMISNRTATQQDMLQIRFSEVSSTISFIYVAFFSFPYFVPGLCTSYNGLLSYGFQTSPAIQTMFFVVTYCAVMCSYFSTYLYLHQAVMPPYNRYKFSTKTLFIAITSLYGFGLCAMPVMFSFIDRPPDENIEEFLVQRNLPTNLLNATNILFQNTHLDRFLYWVQAIACTAWAVMFLIAVVIIAHIIYTFKRMSNVVLRDTRQAQLMWFKSFLLMTSIPVLSMVPSALIVSILLWDVRPHIVVVVNLLNIFSNVHSPLVTIVILLRIRIYTDTVKSWLRVRRSESRSTVPIQIASTTNMTK